MNKQTQCARCIGGKLLAFGDEVQCLNCGWLAPTVEPESPYRRLTLAQL